MQTLSGFDYSAKQNYSKDKAKKVNFMIKLYLLEDLERLVPAGKRSEVVNEALEDKLKMYSIDKAYKLMEEARNKSKLKMNTSETLKIIKQRRK